MINSSRIFYSKIWNRQQYFFKLTFYLLRYFYSYFLKFLSFFKFINRGRSLLRNKNLIKINLITIKFFKYWNIVLSLRAYKFEEFFDTKFEKCSTSGNNGKNLFQISIFINIKEVKLNESLYKSYTLIFFHENNILLF